MAMTSQNRGPRALGAVSVSDAFDPYSEWLGITDGSRPPDRYRLLGLSRFESDPELISHAAVAAMAKVRRIRPGDHLSQWSKLLDELRLAKACLLDPAEKASYDAGLRNQVAASPIASAPKASAPAAKPSRAVADDYDVELKKEEPGPAAQAPSAARPTPAAKSLDEDVLGFQDDDSDLSIAKPSARKAADEDADAAAGYGVGRKAESPNVLGSEKSARTGYRPASTSAGEYALSSDRPSRPAARPSSRASWNGPIGAGLILAALGVGGVMLNSMLAERAAVAPSDQGGGQEPERTPPTARPPADRPPSPSAVGGQKAPDFVASVAAARAALAARNLAAARTQIETAAAAAHTPEQTDQADRLQIMLDHLTQFWEGIRAAMGRLQPGEELKLDNASSVVVESEKNHLKVKTGGRYEEYRAETLPTPLVRLIVQQYFGKDPGSKAIIATFLAVDPQGDPALAARYWQEAAQGGIDCEKLLREVEPRTP